MEEDATLRRTLLGYIENGHRSFLIDFSAVDYFDSFGLGTWVAINLWGCMMGNDSVRQIAKELRRRSEKLDRSTLAQTAERVKDFDEKMQLTKELKDSEMNFFVFFNTIKDFLFVLDEKGRILQVNQAVLTRLEYSMEELTGQSVLQVHPEGERAAAGRIVAEMLAGEADSCLIPLISKSGELIAVETRIVAGNWNGLPALYGVSKDISALKISEEKLTRTFQETSALLCVSTLDEGIYLDVNAAFLHTLGFEREEVIGKKSQDLHIFLQESIRSEILQQILEYSSVRNREIQLRSRNGGTIFGLFSAEIVNVAARRLLVSTVNDVTALKIANEQVAQLNEQLAGVNAELEQRIANRTRELTTAYLDLTARNMELNQVGDAQRRKAEVQTVLWEITEAAAVSPSLEALYATVFLQVGRVLPAKQFSIQLLDEATNEIRAPLNADTTSSIPERRPVGKGMTEHVMRLGRAAYIAPAEMFRLSETGKVILDNTHERHYLGAPLIDSR